MKKRYRQCALVGTAVALVAASKLITDARDVDGCKDAQVCVYKDTNYSGPVAIVPAFQSVSGYLTDFRKRQYTDKSTLDDSASSVVNKSPYTLRLFKGTFYDGRWVDIQPGVRVDLTNIAECCFDPYGAVVADFSDKASSGYLR